MTDVYKAPDATLTEATNIDGYGSLETAVKGEYDFNIGSIYSEAWAKTKGAKRSIWLGLIIYFVVYAIVAVAIPAGLMIALPSGGAAVAVNFVATLASIFIMMPLWAGLFMLGIKRSVDEPIAGAEVINYYHKIIPLSLCMLLMYVLLIIGFLLLVIPGIYLAVAYMMAMPLIVEKDLGPWQALEVSRKTISKKWFKFCGFGLLNMIIFTIAMIPLGLGLIWVFPWFMIAFGILYRNMFGYGQSSQA